MLEQDRLKPPVPRGFAGEDLLRGRFGRGDPIFISGNLVELVEIEHGGEPWYHCSLKVPNHRQDLFIYVLIPLAGAPDATAEAAEEKLAIGAEVRVTGRYLGPRSLPTTDGGRARMPAIAARTMIELTDSTIADPSR